MKNIRLKNITGFILILLIIMLGYNACVKDNFKYDKLTTNNVEWRPNIAVPVAFATLNLRDLLQDYDSTELLVEDGTGFLYVMYESKVASITAENLINISNQSYSENIPVPDLSIVGNQLYAKKEMVKTFDVIGDERIDSIILKTCSLAVTISSTYKHTGTIKFTFPTIKLNGQIFTVNVPISSASGNFNSIKDYDLSSYHIDLTSGPSNYNQLSYTVELWLDDSSSPVQASDNLSINFDFSSIKFSSAYGYFGQKNINIPLDSIVLEVYANAFQGNASVEDPKMNIYINNSYGMEIKANITNLSGYSNIYQPTPLILPSFYNPITIQGPSFNQIGQSLLTEMFLNKSNCNIKSVMSNLPHYILYSVDAQTNPNATPSLQTNFVLDSSKLDVDIEVELPLYGSAKYFVLQDTTEFDVSKFFKDLNPIDWVMFRTNITNGFPTDIGVQAYFTDSLYNVVDSLFERDTQFISSGVINSEGKVIQSTLQTTDVLFPKNRIKKLENVKYALFRGYASTTNNAQEAVRIYSNYGVEVQLAIQAQFTINQAQSDTIF
ncbi:MAG: hypothetical protein A2046_09640 [Bacteroidetes bacterium GWA2_30_7]|nr:MAG: hypothetical protein A2046_09640 [Bacteroidetes bacterium GWA2_30_7]